MPVCPKCNEGKPESAFPMRKDTGRRRTSCVACNSARGKAWDNKNPERRRKYLRDYYRRNREKSMGLTRKSALKRQYGITEADYNAMLAVQGGVCAVCGDAPGKRRLAVDHNHKTGSVRGLLCPPCNMAIGQFRDKPSLMAAAILYLQGRRASDAA